MPRGGYHPHAERWGRKSAWINDSVTKTIRVPLAPADQVLDLAHKLDEGEIIAYDTKSIKALEDENAFLRSQLEELRRRQSDHLPDLEAIRDRILSRWKLQKRAESKDRIKEALDKFIAELHTR